MYFIYTEAFQNYLYVYDPCFANRGIVVYQRLPNAKTGCQTYSYGTYDHLNRQNNTSKSLVSALNILWFETRCNDFTLK